MKTKLLVIGVALAIAWGLKRHYADARAEDLVWILAPTTHVVSVITGAGFEWRAGEGYLSRDRLFLIEKSCAGINFMIAAFGMLVLVEVRRCTRLLSAFSVLGAGMCASYVAAVIVNAVRIAIAMQLATHPAWLSSLGADDVHRIEGIVVYFGGLVMLHEIWTTVDSAFRRAAVPLAMYYGVTLVLPLANGAARSDAFVSHALPVLVVPIVAIVLGAAARTLYRTWRGTDHTLRHRNTAGSESV